MTDIDSMINILADKKCTNCRHHFNLWCGQDHNEESIQKCTCKEWAQRDHLWNFTIPKNPCGEVVISEYSVCCIGRKNED